jgi:hypothetical protein
VNRASTFFGLQLAPAKSTAREGSYTSPVPGKVSIMGSHAKNRSRCPMCRAAVLSSVVAGLVWLCERRANPVNFGDGGRPLGGFGTAFWWSAATMTTVGYGDVAPRTFRGRAIAVVWMFVSLVLVSTFTATMASIMTAERFRQYSPIHGLHDLRPIHVGTFADSSSAQYLEANHIEYRAFRRAELFEALRSGKIQAVFYDEPFLRYTVRNEYPGEFTVFPLNLDTQLYAFAVREAVLCASRSIGRFCTRSMSRPGTTCSTISWELQDSDCYWQRPRRRRNAERFRGAERAVRIRRTSGVLPAGDVAGHIWNSVSDNKSRRPIQSTAVTVGLQ